MCVADLYMCNGVAQHVIQQVTYQTELGQLIDLITAPEDSVDLDKFSLEKCVAVVHFPLLEAECDSGWTDITS